MKEVEFFKCGFMNNTVTDLIILSRFHIAGIPRPVPKFIPASWLPPPQGWLKINSDGTARGSSGMVGVGGVICDYCGYALASFIVPIGVRYALEAELIAVITAIRKASLLQPHPIWIRSDSMHVIRLLRTRSAVVPWTLRFD